MSAGGSHAWAELKASQTRRLTRRLIQVAHYLHLALIYIPSAS